MDPLNFALHRYRLLAPCCPLLFPAGPCYRDSNNELDWVRKARQGGLRPHCLPAGRSAKPDWEIGQEVGPQCTDHLADRARRSRGRFRIGMDMQHHLHMSTLLPTS